jgi:hypothetical protein
MGTPPALLVVAMDLALAPVLVVLTNPKEPVEVVSVIVLISLASKALVVATWNWYVVPAAGGGTKV